MEQVLEYLRESSGVLPLFLLFLAGALEYLVPMLPGDSVVLAGSLVVVAGRWPFLLVWTVVVFGGFLGSAVHFEIGRFLRAPNGGLRGGRWIERLLGRGSLARFIELFRRYGMWVLIANRAVPGVRGVAFIAAGAASLPRTPTLLAGLVSNGLWSAAVLGLGVMIGGNWEQIEAAFVIYKRGALALVGFLVLVYLGVKLRSRAVQRRRAAALTESCSKPDV